MAEKKGYLSPESDGALSDKQFKEFNDVVRDNTDWDAEDLVQLWFRNRRLGIKRTQLQIDGLTESMHNEVADLDDKEKELKREGFDAFVFKHIGFGRLLKPLRLEGQDMPMGDGISKTATKAG